MDWRERLVQTICEVRNAYFADDVEHRRDGRDPDEVIADAILSAIDAAGCVIVPKEATEEMLHNGEGLSDFLLPDAIGNTRERRQEEMAGAYRAMIAARPK